MYNHALRAYISVVSTIRNRISAVLWQQTLTVKTSTEKLEVKNKPFPCIVLR